MFEKDFLKKEYLERGKSLADIAELSNCSVRQVSYWLKKYDIRTRSISEGVYLKRNPDGDPFKLKTKFSKQDMLLLGLGLGLWWGEGSKRHVGTIRLGNTDPSLIKKFVEFLQKILGVPTRKLRFGLQVFSDMDPIEARRFWIRTLKIKESQLFPKTVITPARSIGTYKQKTKYGVLTVHCSNVKLRKHLDTMMKQHAEIAQLVEHVHGGPKRSCP